MTTEQKTAEPPKTYGYDMWKHLHDEHGLTLLDSELHEIERLSPKVQSLEAECAALRGILLALVDRRQDDLGFYYVSRFMGGMGSVVSHDIERALSTTAGAEMLERVKRTEASADRLAGALRSIALDDVFDVTMREIARAALAEWEGK